MKIQAQPDGDVSLSAMAELAGLSTHYFHRRFRREVGETLKQYTLRVRLERAAFRLVLHEVTILDVALDAGFESHETFTRAFARHFGVVPSAYRKSQRWTASARGPGALDSQAEGCELSETKVAKLRPLDLAFIRYLGPYEQVSDQAWARLQVWAEAKGLPPGPLLGIGHDSPSITAEDKLRFDAAVAIPEPFEADSEIGYQKFEGGVFAVTTHVGHFNTLSAAYPIMFERALELKGFRVIGLPCVELYRTTIVDADRALNHTDVYIPLENAERSP